MHQDNKVSMKEGFLAKSLDKTDMWHWEKGLMFHTLLGAIAFPDRLEHWHLDALFKSNYRVISKMAYSPGNLKDSCSSRRGTERYYLKLHNEASQAGVRLLYARLAGGKKTGPWRLFSQAKRTRHLGTRVFPQHSTNIM